MKQFRLPRKIKKTLRRSIWLHPADEQGSSLMASPHRSQADYAALKQGIVRNLIDPKKAKARRKELSDKIDKEVIVSDEELKRYVNDIFREEFRNSSYYTLIAARKNPKAIVAYYHFVNAYRLYEQGDDSYRNICCLSVDDAKKLLKRRKK